jgi:hypothetical protein
MHRKAFLLLTIAVMSLGLATTGCDSNDGPLEKVGESIDDAVDDVGDAVEDATDSN